MTDATKPPATTEPEWLAKFLWWLCVMLAILMPLVYWAGYERGVMLCR